MAKEIEAALEVFRLKGEVAAYSPAGAGKGPTVWLIGKPENRSSELTAFLKRVKAVIKEQEVAYYFLGGELRPGTGVIRRAGGRPQGPSGTLTCLLSSRFSQDLYFVAAGHVATDFWKIKPPDADGSIYLSRPGFPGTNSMRSLGELLYSSKPPRPLHRLDSDRDSSGKTEESNETESNVDIAIVKLQGEFTLKQRTTCYGDFGELLDDSLDIGNVKRVMKCGAEETHWTAAVVEGPVKEISVYGPDSKTVYVLEDQVILKSDENSSQMPPVQPNGRQARQQGRAPQRVQAAVQLGEHASEPPNNSRGTPFAVSGDSGTMIVDKESQRPVGMLIAGSVLDGKYVMTPISTIKKWWEKFNLVLLRA